MSYLSSYCSHFARYVAKMSRCTSKIGYFTVFFTLFLIPWELFDLSYSSYTCSHTAYTWYLASLLLICHELDFRLWESSNWIFQDKSNGEYTTHPQNGRGWKVPLEIICQLVEGLLHLIVQVTNDNVKQYWTQNQPLGHSTSGWCPA